MLISKSGPEEKLRGQAVSMAWVMQSPVPPELAPWDFPTYSSDAVPDLNISGRACIAIG